MKKILYITTLSRTINAFLVPHIEMLINKGNLVDCACYIDNTIDNKLIDKGVKVYNITFTRNPLDISNLKAFKQLITIQEENRYDIVHVHTPIASIYGRLLKLKFPELRTIYTAHGFHFYKGAPLVNWIIYYPIEKIMSKLTDTIITMNEEDYQSALRFNIRQVYKINGVGIDLEKYKTQNLDVNELRRSLSLKKSDFVILMIAEINKNKNHRQMIEAVNLLKKNGINVKVLCAGDGIMFNELKNEICKRKLDENIQMLGFRSDISSLISVCDIGILLSRREGLPRNIMEFMAYGKPVVGTDIRGIKDQVKHNENGMLVGLDDYMETSKCIEKLYKTEELRRDLGLNCKLKVIDYKIDSILEELAYIYESKN